MCFGSAQICEVLGPDPATWSRFEPLPAPVEIGVGMEVFARAVEAAARGEVAEARSVIAGIAGDVLQRWYIEHALWAGKHRCAVLAHSRPKELKACARDPIRRVRRSEERRILEADGYRCRYCRRKVVDKEVFSAFRSVIGSAFFPMSGTDATTHGLVLTCSSVIDHVFPHKFGGRTDRANLVTACYPCNFAKWDYTLDELGLESPRPPLLDDWQGLEEFLPALRARARRDT